MTSSVHDLEKRIAQLQLQVQVQTKVEHGSLCDVKIESRNRKKGNNRTKSNMYMSCKICTMDYTTFEMLFSSDIISPILRIILRYCCGFKMRDINIPIDAARLHKKSRKGPLHTICNECADVTQVGYANGFICPYEQCTKRCHRFDRYDYYASVGAINIRRIPFP
jgi:hypothetical protein